MNPCSTGYHRRTSPRIAATASREARHQARPGGALQERARPRRGPPSQGIQADALTRKSGGGAALLRGIARRVSQDAAAWGAFRTAVQEQIPPETFDALEGLSPETLGEVREAHTTEGLLLAALSAEEEPEEGVVEMLVDAWRDERGAAERQASEDAHVRDLEAELERVKGENERLSFASRAARERAAALAEEVEVLTGERTGTSELVRKAEERAASAVDARGMLEDRVETLEKRSAQLERALEGERKAYSTAAERVEQLHEELGSVVEERDRIKNALQDAHFTDRGFGELLVRAIKNEVASLPTSLESTAQAARLMEFMAKVLQAQADLRSGPREPGPRTREEDPDDKDSSQASRPEEIDRPAGSVTVGGYARPRPTLSFRALGGAGEVGGSSHLLDFGKAKILVDAGIKPDGRGPATPDFGGLNGIDAAVITHAHLDHCGALPLLVRDRPGMPIYCTPPSAKLIVSALNDHAAMGGGLPGGAPIHEVRKRLVPVPFGKPLDVGGTKVTLTESGHILGGGERALLLGAFDRLPHGGHLHGEPLSRPLGPAPRGQGHRFAHHGGHPGRPEAATVLGVDQDDGRGHKRDHVGAGRDGLDPHLRPGSGTRDNPRHKALRQGVWPGQGRLHLRGRLRGDDLGEALRRAARVHEAIPATQRPAGDLLLENIRPSPTTTARASASSRTPAP